LPSACRSSARWRTRRACGGRGDRSRISLFTRCLSRQPLEPPGHRCLPLRPCCSKSPRSERFFLVTLYSRVYKTRVLIVSRDARDQQCVLQSSGR
jgi:hypothetical protein